jgi:antitoxin (DNA-binding transcriptional repressor) of toxin-antitoxin stability system
MKKARIAVAKNNFSRLIDDVKRGETVLILDRDTPVARLEPIGRDRDLQRQDVRSPAGPSCLSGRSTRGHSGPAASLPVRAARELSGTR